MKVLIISHMYPTLFKENHGLFVHQQVQELINNGCKIKVISPVARVPFFLKYVKKKWLQYAKLPQNAVIDGVEVYYPRYLEFPRSIFFASSGKRMFYGINKLIKTIHDEFPFDIIHAHVALPDGWVAMKAAQKFNKPFIITIHGQDFQRTIFINKRCRFQIQDVIYHSVRTVCVSNKLKCIGVRELHIGNEKMVVIPNGINPDIFIHDSGEPKRVSFRNKIVILSVSHLIETKGVDYNIQAVFTLKKDYPKLEYHIIGDGRERQKLTRLVQDLGLQDRVKFLGQLPYNHVIKHISNCDIFSLPSWEEGFGIVYLEAMGHGIPMIGCENQGIADVVRNGVNGLLVAPKSSDAVAKALDFLLRNPKEAKRIGKRGREIVLKEYTWEKNVQRTIELYREVIC